ncbi:peptide deformylase [Rothia santali]|uniref:peptide deformylase n=1 Tax=Rothia santali TaxID=2949643 RepID=UPI002815D75C|nr:peptide deformylase [Rothia santali]
MTILPIRTVGDPVLRTPCDPVTAFDAELSRLIDDMVETMFDVGGVGLAGPQVGVPLRLFTYGIEGPGGEVGHVVNPVLELGEEPQEGGEGCLSVPELSAESVPRRLWARVTGVDRENRPVVVEGEGLLARCLQHETDHLDGTLYLDRLEGEERRRLLRALRAADYESLSEGVRRERGGRTGSGFGPGSAFGAGSSFGAPASGRGSSFGAPASGRGSSFGAGSGRGSSFGAGSGAAGGDR